MGCSSSIDRNSIVQSNSITPASHSNPSYYNGSTPYRAPGTPPDQTAPTKFRFKFDQRVIQKYHIEALIGTGSFSKVVRGRHRLTKVEYAIKIVSKPEEGSEGGDHSQGGGRSQS